MIILLFLHQANTIGRVLKFSVRPGISFKNKTYILTCVHLVKFLSNRLRRELTIA